MRAEGIGRRILELRVYGISGVAKRGQREFDRVLDTGKLKDLIFQEMPRWFETVVHLGSLD